MNMKLLINLIVISAITLIPNIARSEPQLNMHGLTDEQFQVVSGLLVQDYCLLKLRHPFRRGYWFEGLRAIKQAWNISERTVDLVAMEIGGENFHRLSEHLGGCRWLTRDLEQ